MLAIGVPRSPGGRHRGQPVGAGTVHQGTGLGELLAQRDGDDLPPTITLVPLPPDSPQLNPMQRVWLDLRGRFLSLRILDGGDVIVDVYGIAWTVVADDPDRIRSPCLYPYIDQMIA